MKKFNKFDKYTPDTLDLLGITPLTQITDNNIWEHLIPPQVASLVGEIESVDSPKVTDRAFKDTPELKVFNEYGKDLYLNHPEKVRSHYIYTIYRGKIGNVIIQRHGIKVKVSAWIGTSRTGTPELIFMTAMKDRRFDGSPRTNDCPLVDFPYDSYEENNLEELKLKFSDARAAEVSIYYFLPGSSIEATTGDSEFQHFFRRPYEFINEPDKFLELFNRAMKTRRAPGQIAASIPGAISFLFRGWETIGRKYNYDYLQCVPSYYHVFAGFMNRGYNLSREDQKKLILPLHEKLVTLSEKYKPAQLSWIAIAQSLPENIIPEEINLGGPKWPKTNLDLFNPWMHKPISERAMRAAS